MSSSARRSSSAHPPAERSHPELRTREIFSDADHIKCYEAPPKGTNPKVPKVVIDPFVTETVNVGVQQYVCVGAFKCDVGATDCGPSPE